MVDEGISSLALVLSRVIKQSLKALLPASITPLCCCRHGRGRAAAARRLCGGWRATGVPTVGGSAGVSAAGLALPRALWVLSLSRCFNEGYVTSRCSRAPRPAPVALLHCSLRPSGAGTLKEGILRAAKCLNADLWQQKRRGQAEK